ncbi:helix-turn-helix domain-containing protein [Streptomyces sp. NPDC090741]|uniref:helix-turn-helix domain-containing protein n=1 Tax=Streptomyces sp. NPDC090741 TaxID=3365967 RepID=UPI0037F7664F
MGRPEAPVDRTVPERAELSELLRAARARSGSGKPLTYEALARRTAWSSAALKRAASGRRLPAWDLVEAFLTACQVGSAMRKDALHLYTKAQHAVALRAKEERATTVVPRPQLVTDEADLSRALRDAYGYAGRPPVRTLSQRAGQWVLPHSSAHRIITARALPVNVGQYVGFLEACEVTSKDLPDWFTAWHKVMGPPWSDTPDEVSWWRTSTWGEELYETWFYETYGHSATVAA